MVRAGPARPAWRRDAIRYQNLNFRLIERMLARLYEAARWLFGLRRHGRPRASRQAARLGHVLPPRPSGTLSAIEAAPQAGLVIVAHTGLDHLEPVAAVWKGIPLQGPPRVTWWRILAGDVPSGKDARTEWLNAYPGGISADAA